MTVVEEFTEQVQGVVAIPAREVTLEALALNPRATVELEPEQIEALQEALSASSAE
jgi:hypothetical protein